MPTKKSPAVFTQNHSDVEDRDIYTKSVSKV
jgi:hypothetical protein